MFSPKIIFLFAISSLPTLAQSPLSISSDGQVGVGIDKPESKLHVVGTILSTGDAAGFQFRPTDIKDGDWKWYAKDGIAILRHAGGGDIIKISKEGDLNVNGRVNDAFGALVPVGSVIAFGGNSIPKGWLECNGQSIKDISDYQYLKTALGMDNVPDLRSRFIVGVGPKRDMNYIDPKNDQWKKISLSGYNLNNYAGEEMHTLTINEMPNHNHGTVIGPWGGSHIDAGWDGGGHDWQNMQTASAGGSQPHENRPPYWALRYIIKY